MVDEAVFAVLLAQVEETKLAHREAKERFWAAAGKPRELPRLPPGRAHPEGSESIRQAVSEERFAEKAYIEAMMLLNRYLIDGSIPDDVKERLGRKTNSIGS